MSGELAAARRALAADLQVAVRPTLPGFVAYPVVPASFTPPCAWVAPGVQYLGAPLTGCTYAVQVMVRFVTGVADNAGAYDQLDELLEVCLPVVGRYQSVDIAVRSLTGSDFLCADALVAYGVDLKPN